jgi:hypothetical protein
MYRRSLRGNREISRSTTGLGPSGPRREGDEPKPAMHEREKSDPAIPATKPANAPARAEAELAEQGRGVTVTLYSTPICFLTNCWHNELCLVVR